MIIQEFSFSNFRSFKEQQTLNLAAAKIKSRCKDIDFKNTIRNIDGVPFCLKSKAIYGANASGKSNVIKAILLFVRVVATSVKDEKVLSVFDPFRLSTQTEAEPSFCQLIFWIDQIRYRYGFEVLEGDVVSEWLYAKPKERELPYFIREGQKEIKVDKKNFPEGKTFLSLLKEGSGENEIYRSNSLFLSSISALGIGKVSKKIVKNIGSMAIINGLGHVGMHAYASESLDDPRQKRYMLDLLKFGDIGIQDIENFEFDSNEFEQEPNESDIPLDKGKRKMLVSSRFKYNRKEEFHESESFLMNLHESEGTKKLFELSPFIYRALKRGTPLIIDEFDARFHPLLTRKIVELFHSEQNVGAQLIFVTHDTNLLTGDLLRRDQIDFVEKDKYGASHLYSLVEFKGIRNTASFEKDYIQGKYGAIPFLGDFSKLLEIEANAEIN